MKKLMIAMGAAALLGAVHADGIVSSDIVGYATDSLTSGNFNMNAVVFNPILGETIDLNGSAITFENPKGGYDDTDADSIRVWSPITSGYTVFYYDIEDECWYPMTDGDTEHFATGQAFWYRSRGTEMPKITTSGAVENSADVTIPLTAGNFNMVVNPYPIVFDLNNTSQVEFINPKGGYDDTDADSIKIWNPITSGYTVFYFDIEDTCWYPMTDGDTENFPAKPFWYRSRGTTAPSITFKKTF